MSNYLESLNERQKTAVLHTEGPLLILAGAGAGKTKTLTARIAHLMEKGVPGYSILAITFTNKAAKEMRDRATNLIEKIGGMNSLPTIATFHSLGVRILREQTEAAGLKKGFVIADESDALSIIKQALADLSIDPKQYEPKKIKNIISREKGKGVTWQEYERKAEIFFHKTIARIWQKYEEGLKRENTVDFDDLLLKVVNLFDNRKDILEHYQEKFKYIHIDEYQDTNDIQYRIATSIASKYKNICAVGDTDQTIYSWRGANISNILSFENDYKDATVVLLEQNYRSTKTILAAANDIIKKNTERHDKTLFTEKPDGEQISIFEGYDENTEAEFVSDKVVELLDNGVHPSKIAILYRANFQSRVIEDALIRKSLPYQVLGVKFFDRKEVKDVLSYLRAAHNPESLADIKRTINFPARGIGKTTLLKIFAGERGSLPAGTGKKVDDYYKMLKAIKIFSDEHLPSETISYILKVTGIEKFLKDGGSEELERLGNVLELVTLAMKYDTYNKEIAIEQLLEDAALMSDQDTLSTDDRGGVRLMTVHASKGLEFPYVFVVGLEHGLFPLERDGVSSLTEKEEERRLMYVAVTRAEEKLFLSYTTIRTIFGSRQINVPSTFLFDIRGELTMREEWHTNLGRTIYLD